MAPRLGPLLRFNSLKTARLRSLLDKSWGQRHVTIGIVMAGLRYSTFAPWEMLVVILRGAGTALVLFLLGFGYARIRSQRGLGMGDVKLATAVGIWLPLEDIPLCFCLASMLGLAGVLIAEFRGRPIKRTTKVSFGAYLCPALWFIWLASVLST